MLSEFEYVNTTNVDFAEHKMSSLFAGHRLILDKSSDFSVRYAGVPLDEDTSVNFFSYGSNVEVHPDPIMEFYLIQIPLKGVGILHNRDGEIDIRPGVLGVQNPDAIEKTSGGVAAIVLSSGYRARRLNIMPASSCRNI